MKEIEEEDRAHFRAEQKKLSSNERELNRFVEEDRQVAVKKALEKYRARENEKSWRGKTALDAPNMFKEETTILKQPNLFVGGKNLFVS